MATINALAYALLANKLRQKITRPSVLPFLTHLGGGALVAGWGDRGNPAAVELILCQFGRPRALRN
ncbi:MAG: hypothetical protein ACK5LJ_13810 [Paracoccus sp. (in: a-proteobacteria)]